MAAIESSDPSSSSSGGIVEERKKRNSYPVEHRKLLMRAARTARDDRRRSIWTLVYFGFRPRQRGRPRASTARSNGGRRNTLPPLYTVIRAELPDAADGRGRLITIGPFFSPTYTSVSRTLFSLVQFLDPVDGIFGGETMSFSEDEGELLAREREREREDTFSRN